MNVPRLRFKEFAEKWEVIKLGDNLVEYKERVSSPTDLPILTSARTGLYFQKDYFSDRELQNEGQYGVVPRGYFTYRLMSDDSTFKFNINNLVDKGAISKEYPVFTTCGMNSYFLLQKLNHGEEFKLFAIIQKRGGTRTRLYFNKLIELELIIPSLPEQTKIANFLMVVDEKIAQLTQKGNLLARYKKGVMQQIFSQQLRFKDDDGQEFSEWGEKELKDVAAINPKTSSLPDQFIYIDLESVENGRLLKETMILSNEAPSRAQRVLKKEDVLFQMVRPYQKNNLFFYKDGEYVASTGYSQIRAFQNPRFLYHYLHLDDFNAEVMNRCTGTSYPAINSSDLATISIQMPCAKEQTKIANFLTALDDKISHNQTQLNALKQYKQGLLQQLFV